MRPTCGQVETRSAEVTLDGRRIRSRVPFGVESRDLGGFTEIIEPGALRSADMSDLVARIEHGGLPLARHPGTLEINRDDGSWSFEPPQSRQDVIEAVSRGDLRGSSFRMVVGRDRWVGDTRHITEIRKLKDVSLVADPAYDAAVELRSNPNPATGQEDTMAETAESTTQEQETTSEATGTAETAGQGNGQPEPENRSQEAEDRSQGRLRVESRNGSSGPPRRTLGDEIRSRFPANPQLGNWGVTLDSWNEYESRARTGRWETEEDRSVTWSGTIALLNQTVRQGVPFPYDERWAWPAFARVGVDPATTEVRIFQQTARSLATPASMTRAIDAVTTKPETGSTINLVSLGLNQVASKNSGVPNIYLLQPNFGDIINEDLRLALNDALDALLQTALAASGFQAPGTDNLYVSIRKAMTTLQNGGYNPDTLLATPADAQTLDVMVSGITGGTADFVNGPGQYAPDPWGLKRRVSKTIPATAVVDSAALGKLYSGPVSFAKFEENFGQTNSSTVRLECNAGFGVERQAAAVRIAAA